MVSQRGAKEEERQMFMKIWYLRNTLWNNGKACSATGRKSAWKQNHHYEKSPYPLCAHGKKTNHGLQKWMLNRHTNKHTCMHTCTETMYLSTIPTVMAAPHKGKGSLAGHAHCGLVVGNPCRGVCNTSSSQNTVYKVPRRQDSEFFQIFWDNLSIVTSNRHFH